MMVLGLILFPLVQGLVLFAFAKHSRAAQWVNLLGNVAWAILLVAGVGHFALDRTDFPTQVSLEWMPVFKSHFALGVDGLNFPLVALNVFLSLLLAFYALGKEKLGATYLGLFSILNAASVGSLLAADALVFYLFWEFMLIPMYFLIGRWGSKNRVYAALKFFAFTMTGSLFLLAAVVALALKPDLASLGWADIHAAKFAFEGWNSTQGLLFLGFLLAFLVKIPVWPLHTWLPDAHTEAPTGGSVILAGVLLKLGVYGIARWCLPLFPEAAVAAAPTILVLGVLGIILGSLAAWKQADIKRMIAYSSVAHLGFMAIGLFALNTVGLQGAMFQNIAHGLATGALFLIFGIIYDRTHTREVSQYGGLAEQNPWLATFFVVASLASIGLPGLPGFVGEFLILTSAFKVTPWISIVASLGVLLGAIYTLSLVRRLVFGRTSSTLAHHPVVLNWSEWVAVVPLVLAMIYFGLHPNTLLGFAGQK